MKTETKTEMFSEIEI